MTKPRPQGPTGSRNFRTPVVGQRVVSIAGHYVGQVKDVAEERFRVVTDRGEDVWLDRGAIFTSVPHVLTLVCDLSGVERYRVPPPASRAAG